MADTCAAAGVAAGAAPGHPGCWVDAGGPLPRKIGALGIRVARGVSFHGIALNVTTNLADFDLIDPCGMPGLRSTSIARERARARRADADRVERRRRARTPADHGERRPGRRRLRAGPRRAAWASSSSATCRPAPTPPPSAGRSRRSSPGPPPRRRHGPPAAGIRAGSR